MVRLYYEHVLRGERRSNLPNQSVSNTKLLGIAANVLPMAHQIGLLHVYADECRTWLSNELEGAIEHRMGVHDGLGFAKSVGADVSHLPEQMNPYATSA